MSVLSELLNFLKEYKTDRSQMTISHRNFFLLITFRTDEIWVSAHKK